MHFYFNVKEIKAEHRPWNKKRQLLKVLPNTSRYLVCKYIFQRLKMATAFRKLESVVCI